ncbi:MAG: hypothetical protein OXH36_00960 [Bdellovibrionales bacterium]|nr:hypothetical protein [Bdellovibrionales bacterium]
MFRVLFTMVLFYTSHPLAFSSTDDLLKLKSQVSEEEAQAIEEEIQLREFRAMEEEVQLREEEMEKQMERASADGGDMVQGVMLTFKKYPVPDKDKELIINKLKKAGLSKYEEIKRFKMWIYNWKKAKTELQVERLCKELLFFSIIENCESNALAHPGYTVDLVNGAKEMVRKAEVRLEKSKETVKRYEELVKKYTLGHARVQGLVVEAKGWVKKAEQNLQAAIKSGDNSKIAYAQKRVDFYKKWLGSRMKWLENSKKWLADRKSWLEKAKGWVERDKKWLAGRIDWLKKMETALANRSPSQPPPKTPVQDSPQDDKDRSQLPQTPVSGQPSSGSDLKSCNIISHKLKLSHAFSYLQKRNAPLSDYWAQEMIGADLLRKELRDLPKVDKHFIQLFDINKPEGPRGHDNTVKNLISDSGGHSVLPKLGENAIGINQTPSSGAMVKYSDQLLTKAEEKCSHLQSNPGGGIIQ